MLNETNQKLPQMKNIHQLLLFLVLTSCLNDNQFSIPKIECQESNFTNTHSILEIKKMVGFGITEFTEDFITSGYVVSSDESGNIYKILYLQDKIENPTAALKISLDKTALYTQYPIGKKIFIKLKGLAIGYTQGSVTIGSAGVNEIERIPSTEINQHLFRSCESSEITPKEMQLSEINGTHVGMLVQLNNVQFKQSELKKSFAEDNKDGDVLLEQVNATCQTEGEILLHTSSFSIFKNITVPSGRGNLTAIVTKYFGTFQLVLPNSNNVIFNFERCLGTENNSATISFQQLNEMYTGSVVEMGIETPIIFEGYVISSDENGNFKNRLFLQDAIENPTGGLQILVEEENLFENFQIGQKVFLHLNKLYLTKIDDILTVGVFKKDNVDEIPKEETFDYVKPTLEIKKIIPKSINLNELENLPIESILATVNNVQLSEKDKQKAFAYFSGNESATRILENCSTIQKLLIFTNGEADFANEKFPNGQGTITGILTNKNDKAQMMIRNTQDILFENPSEICPKIIPQILITEIADPENNTEARFVELYNAGTESISLQGWKLQKYINGSELVSVTGLVLSGILKPKSFYILSAIEFENTYGITTNIYSTYISGNGDDVYELVDSDGKTQDIYGIIGEDGSGKNWEYTDGQAQRKIEIGKPNAVFDSNEWIIFSKATGNPRTAPFDFNPKTR